MKVKRLCEGPWCSKTFEAFSWDVRRNRGRFCSHRCVGEWLSVKMTKRPENKTKQVG